MGEKDENSLIGIVVDGKFRELQPCNLGRTMEQLESTSLNDFDCGNGESYIEIGEMRIDAHIPLGELGMVLCGICTMEQLKQNNWRRMHGLQMRRRKRK